MLLCFRLAVLAQNDDVCHYTTALFDFMAACAEGENKFIESLCQKVLSPSEILDVMSSTHVSVSVRSAFVRYTSLFAQSM